jgi:predicted  nucleic acid-binding Zn-ribbon protein
MIKEILCIYIIDNKGTPIFIRENYIQGSGNADHALLSDFISALQSFAKEFGEEETRMIELSDAKIYSARDKLTNYYFIIKCDINTKNKKMFDILNKIKNLFIDKSLGQLTSNDEKKKQIMASFEDALNDLLEPRENIEDFLKSI